jgi:two-component sensor histidine kinase
MSPYQQKVRRKMREVDPHDLVETIREGLLVLEPDLTIRFASRSFCDQFSVAPDHTVGQKLYELGNGQWDIPKLRTALETIVSGGKTIEAFEVEQVFPSIGQRVMVLNARKVYRPGKKTQQILLAIEDVTERVRLERERTIAHERIGMMLQELTHGVKNSLQIIASMVRIEAQGHKSGEGKSALDRVSHRIDALAHLYSKLSEAGSVEMVDTATYLSELCRDLIASVHKEESTAIVLKTDIGSEHLPTDRAIPIGLIVNELVTNAVKYAFPADTKGTVLVTLKRVPGELRLTVADDGQGVDPRRADSGRPPGRRLRPTARRAHRAKERYPRDDRGPHLAGARTIVVELRARGRTGSRQNVVSSARSDFSLREPNEWNDSPAHALRE